MVIIVQGACVVFLWDRGTLLTRGVACLLFLDLFLGLRFPIAIFAIAILVTYWHRKNQPDKPGPASTWRGAILPAVAAFTLLAIASVLFGSLSERMAAIRNGTSREFQGVQDLANLGMRRGRDGINQIETQRWIREHSRVDDVIFVARWHRVECQCHLGKQEDRQWGIRKNGSPGRQVQGRQGVAAVFGACLYVPWIAIHLRASLTLVRHAVQELCGTTAARARGFVERHDPIRSGRRGGLDRDRRACLSASERRPDAGIFSGGISCRSSVLSVVQRERFPMLLGSTQETKYPPDPSPTASSRGRHRGAGRPIPACCLSSRVGNDGGCHPPFHDLIPLTAPKWRLD